MFFRLPDRIRILIALSGMAVAMPLRADDTDLLTTEPEIEYRVAQVSAGSGGVYTYKAGEWGLLRLILTNNRDVPVELECTTYFDVEPTLQYGRRIWMPAMSRLMTSHPILLPEQVDPESRRVPFHTQVAEVSSGDREMIHDEIGKLLYSSELQVESQPIVTGIITPIDAEVDTRNIEFSPNDLITSGRFELQLPRRVSSYGDRVLSATDLGLQSLDQLVVADDRFQRDSAAIAAIRHWLYDGGRLWIMLDRVDPELLQSLLGDESSCQVVDTVTLNHLTMSSTRETGGFPDIVSDYEDPLKLVRVIVEDEEVPILVNGWPAAFQKTCGRGRLLVTTLQGNAWLTKRSLRELGSIQNPENFWPYAPTPAFQDLMTFLFQESVEDAPITENFDPKLREFVGYSIPSKGIVFSVLSGFVVLLGSGGFWLCKSGRLERLAILTPLVTIVATGTLVFLGQLHRQSVPPSTALLQLVRPIPGTNGVIVSGSAALYSPDSTVSELQGEAGGWITPQLDGTEGTIRRMMWTDSDQWQWEGVPQPAGLRTAEFQVSMEAADRIAAKAVFGPEGLNGSLSVPAGMTPMDAIVASRAGRIAVDLQEDGTFTAASDQVLGPDEFLRAGLLNDDQARRTRILAEFFQQPSHAQMLEPHLLFWTPPVSAGLHFADDARESGMALFVVPIELQRPAAGTLVSLPAPLVSYREASGPDGYQPSGLFDARKGVWTPRAHPSTSWLSFQFPAVLRPLDIQSARLEIRVTGPMGRIDLAMARGGEVVDLYTWMDPVGTLTYELNSADLNDSESSERLLLRFAVGDPDRPELTETDPETGKLSYWRIESLTMEVDAVVLPTEAPAEAP